MHKVLGVDDREYIDFYNKYGHLLHRDSKIRFGAKQAINSLYKNHQIHFVTAREEKMRNVSLEWLHKYQIPMNSITLLGSHNKVRKAMELESDIFIEDRYDNAVQLSEAGFSVLLIDCTYNKGTLSPNITRISNWYQIKEFIDHMHKSRD